jgi:hypothetical protein
LHPGPCASHPLTLANLIRAHTLTLTSAHQKKVTAAPAKAVRAPAGKKKLTVPKPFKFHESAKALGNVVATGATSAGGAGAGAAPASPFVPLAVKVQRFQKQTPDRFKSKVLKVRTRVRTFA